MNNHACYLECRFAKLVEFCALKVGLLLFYLM